MIAEGGIEVSFLIFFRINVGILLGPMLLFKLRVCIKSYFIWSCWCHEEWFCIWVFTVIRKIPLCWWYVFLEFFANCCKVIIKIFCNFFWLTYSSVFYEKTIQFPCIGFWFTIDYFIDPNPNALQFLLLSSKYVLYWDSWLFFRRSTIMVRYFL